VQCPRHGVCGFTAQSVQPVARLVPLAVLLTPCLRLEEDEGAIFEQAHVCDIIGGLTAAPDEGQDTIESRERPFSKVVGYVLAHRFGETPNSGGIFAGQSFDRSPRGTGYEVEKQFGVGEVLNAEYQQSRPRRGITIPTGLGKLGCPIRRKRRGAEVNPREHLAKLGQ
jgi:hypothetical protein